MRRLPFVPVFFARGSTPAFLSSALALLFLVSGSAQAQSADRPLNYLESVSDGADPNSALPLLIILHGLGDRPENFIPVFESLPVKARLIAPRAPDPAGDGGSWYPFDNEAKATSGMLSRALKLAELIELVIRSRPTLGKPVVTGFSQGGVLSFALAAYYPDQLFAAVPLAGSLPSDMPSPRTPPRGFIVAAFHGKTDERVPYKDGARTVAWLKRAKFKASIKGYPGVGHALTDKMREQAKHELAGLLTAAAAPPKPPNKHRAR